MAEKLQSPPDVGNRWTPLLTKKGWTPVVNSFLDNYHRLDPPMKYAEAMFVIHLVRYKWGSDKPYPSFKTLGLRMGISPQAARIIARNLQKKNYLVREFTTGETNRFNLRKLFDALEMLEMSSIQKAPSEKAS